MFLLDLRQRSPKLLLAGLIACGAYQAHFLLPYTLQFATEARQAVTCPAGDRLRVLTLKVLRGNNRAAPVLNFIRATKPDLFLALEADRAWARALQPLRADYPHVMDASRDSYWGMMLFSRLPLANPEVRHLIDGYLPSIRADSVLPPGSVPTFYGLHPKPLVGGNIVARGDAELIIAGREIRVRRGDAVLAGDLNDVPWSRTMQLFKHVSDMRDPRVGRALYPTYKTDAPLLSWPIDHVFASPAFSVLNYRKLQDVGSDHYPVEATLCYSPTKARSDGDG